MSRILLSLMLFCLIAMSCSSDRSAREHTSFNDDWRFTLAENGQEYYQTDVDDSGWRTLNVPHDWSIESNFAEENPATPGGGALPGGKGWYRKHFKLPAADSTKSIYIDFDGVYRNSKVWINGHLLGFRPNGYVSFRYDLTPYLNYGDKENVVAVLADNSEQPNSRWYSGSGIYRNVWMVKTGKVHVDLWGTFVTTPVVNKERAEINVVTTLKNTSPEKKTIEIFSSLADPGGKIISYSKAERDIEGASCDTISQNFDIAFPQLWDTDHPHLYKILTQVRSGNKVLDSYETPFGLRSFRWEAETGFYLNDKPTKINGVCLHHDLGCLGSAVNERAIERQLQIMKDMGVNAIRTSHNPPTPELLDLCDRMGLLVQDEAFDMWRRRKSPHDYARYFDEWHERDLTDQVLRDRNHPSVFMWSIGNEVLEQWPEADADTLSLEQANMILNAGHAIDPKLLDDTTMSLSGLIAHSLTAIVKRLDTTRVVTAANNETSPSNLLFRSGALDVEGFNYHEKSFEPFPQNFPGRKLIVSESTSALMTRGYYMMPSDSMYIWPISWRDRFERPEHLCSSYDNCHVPWGSTHEVTLREVERLPHVAGMFIWTGFDYLGEPTPYWWPSRSSFFGIVDLAGFPKDVYYMYQSTWTNKPVLHVFPHWNWKEGDIVDVWAYYNNADEAELFLNGESQGKKSKTDSTYHVSWRVPFSSGAIKVVTRKEGKEVMSKEVKTAGEAARIVLTADRSTIDADGTDLSFITAEIKDKDGNLVPDANSLIRFTVEGDGFIAGTDNGDQNDHSSLKNPNRKAFYGKAMAVVQNKGKRGTIKLKAESENIQSETITINCK